MANPQDAKLQFIKDADEDVLLEMLNLFLDQIIEREKKVKYIRDIDSGNTRTTHNIIQSDDDLRKIDDGEYQRYWLNREQLYSLFMVGGILEIPDLYLNKKSMVITKREMLEMVSAFFKEMGTEINSLYLKQMINLLNTNRSTYMYNSDDGEEILQHNDSVGATGRARVFGGIGESMLELPAFYKYSEIEKEALEDILDPKKQYVSMSDPVILVHEMTHMIHKPEGAVESYIKSAEIWETNAILMETLFEDFVRSRYPDYAAKMDYFSYDRMWNSWEHMTTVWTILDLANYKIQKGQSLNIEDLKNFSENSLIGIDFREDDHPCIGVDPIETNRVSLRNLTDIRASRLRTFLKAYFSPVAQPGFYIGNRRVLKSEEAEKRVRLVSNIEYRNLTSYALGSLLVPSLRRAFYECEDEEGIQKINEYFRLFDENRIDEAMNVFGIDAESQEGIKQIHLNYLAFIDELTDRLQVNIPIYYPEDGKFEQDTEEYDEEEDYQPETEEERLEILSDDDGTLHINDYEIPDEKYARDDDDDGR